MKKIDSALHCPACHNGLNPVVLACTSCGVKVEGPFQFNEFALLSPEDLHFLRIFIRCEGRIREMEPALGLSYPTIRSRLSAFKNKVLGSKPKPAAPRPMTKTEILQRLEEGEVTFEEAMKQIKNIRMNRK